jgi:broad specificity phosphatase PhoE
MEPQKINTMLRQHPDLMRHYRSGAAGAATAAAAEEAATRHIVEATVIYDGSKPPNDTSQSTGVTTVRDNARAASLVPVGGHMYADYDSSDAAKFLDALPSFKLAPIAIVASHGGFIRRVAAHLVKEGSAGAEAAVERLKQCKDNNLFALRLTSAASNVVLLVRHCARLHQKQGPFSSEYVTPDPGCIVGPNNQMWGAHKLARALAAYRTNAQMCSSMMNRAVETSVALALAFKFRPPKFGTADEIAEASSSVTVTILPFCREGGNHLDMLGLDVLNRPGDNEVNTAMYRIPSLSPFWDRAV